KILGLSYSRLRTRTHSPIGLCQFDRKNNFYFIPHVRFPVPGDPNFTKWHVDTIIDGELVEDTEEDGTKRLRYLLFDCLVFTGKILVERSLMKRLGVSSIFLHVALLAPIPKFSACYRIYTLFPVIKNPSLSYPTNSSTSKRIY
ncbi:hypothetical protein BC936DRAFT_143846, partial [Jimgerdemannia flammicorona]